MILNIDIISWIFLLRKNWKRKLNAKFPVSIQNTYHSSDSANMMDYIY